MARIPGALRAVLAFLDEHDYADPDAGLAARVSDLKDVAATLEWRSRVFSALRRTTTRKVVVPEGLHDPDERGLRDLVWEEARVRGIRVKMDNRALLRTATMLPRAAPSARQDLNSRRTRVVPVFAWLRANGGPAWADALVRMASGL